jgi:hypothetical protein
MIDGREKGCEITSENWTQQKDQRLTESETAQKRRHRDAQCSALGHDMHQLDCQNNFRRAKEDKISFAARYIQVITLSEWL